MPRNADRSSCHPDRERFHNSLCFECYRASGAPPFKLALCHPKRKHYGKGDCRACYTVKWNKAHPDSNSGAGWLKRHPKEDKNHRRRSSLKRHGLTLEDYNAMWKSQGGRCANAACRKRCPMNAKDYRHALQVDHCHTTGRVRALLCRWCNTALGHVNDSPGVLRGLANYLEALN